MKLIEYPDSELMMFDLADVLASELSAALRQNERATFCVPGGTTPGPIFDVLSAVNLDWSRVTVLPSDERWLPETNERSNARLIRNRLLTGKAAAATFQPLYEPTDLPEDAVDDLGAAVGRLLPISVLLLGMGADMHTASLFPDGDRLATALDPEAPVIVPMRAPGAGEPRVTLSAPVLADAMSIHILITGRIKRAALDSAMSLPATSAPVRAVLDEATVHWAP